MMLIVWAEGLTHHINEFEDASIADPVKNPVGILAGTNNTLVPQYRQVLGNIAL